MVPDRLYSRTERAVAYSGEDAFEAACVALCVPAPKLQAKPPMSEHLSPLQN